MRLHGVGSFILMYTHPEIADDSEMRPKPTGFKRHAHTTRTLAAQNAAGEMKRFVRTASAGYAVGSAIPSSWPWPNAPVMPRMLCESNTRRSAGEAYIFAVLATKRGIYLRHTLARRWIAMYNAKFRNTRKWSIPEDHPQTAHKLYVCAIPKGFCRQTKCAVDQSHCDMPTATDHNDTRVCVNCGQKKTIRLRAFHQYCSNLTNRVEFRYRLLSNYFNCNYTHYPVCLHTLFNNAVFYRVHKL